MNTWVDFLQGILLLIGTVCLGAVMVSLTYLFVSFVVWAGVQLNNDTNMR